MQLAVALGMALAAGTAASQGLERSVADEGIERLRAASNGTARIERAASGLARFISFPEGFAVAVTGAAPASPESRAVAFLRLYGTAFGLAATPEVRLVRILARDAAQMEHVRFQQMHRGLPIAGAELIVHLREDRVMAVNGRTVADEELKGVPTAPQLAARRALAAARGVMTQTPAAAPPTLSPPRLEIFNRGLLKGRPSPSRLAWFVTARAERVYELIWVDATTGAILLHFDQQPDARQRDVYTAENGTSLPGSLVRSEGQADSGDADADAAYRFAGDTYDYFWTRFGRDSIDAAGQPLVLTVHYDVNFQNAFWDTLLEQAAFGDASAQADDVVAHEISHGLTQHTADLFYYEQSGALNESVSDIFGETVDLLNYAGDDSPEVRWLASEDWAGVGPIRNMMDPNAMGSPARMGDPLLQCGEYDNGGVHTNSGILNHAYALAVDGGTYNSQMITGIGLEKAGAVVYRALTTYLTTTSDFADADSAIRQSCQDLIGFGDIQPADCEDFARALDAVEMGSPWPCPEASIVVAKRGGASGTVTSHPPGIDCGLTCVAPFPAGSMVTLEATPDPGVLFTGWGGKCSGVGYCDVWVEGREEVTAGFDVVGTTYTVAVSTSGTGAVTSSPAGIDCGADCDEAFLAGSTVTLTAVAPAGWALQAWGGDCGGRGLCTLTIDGPKTVTATFAESAFAESTTLDGVRMGRAAWGDYDSDGDLDLVVVGKYGSKGAVVYRNEGGSFVDAEIALVSAQDFAAWGDYDGDGDLDLVVGGWTGAAPWYATQLYRNDGGAFAPVPTPFVGVGMGAAASWGDYDSDGDLDLVIAGHDGHTMVTRLYQNVQGTFVDSGIPLAGVYYCDLAWADYDRDGDVDLVVGGGSSSGGVTLLYRNDNGALVNSGTPLPGADSGSVAWADYDADGDLDLALTGVSTSGLITKVFRNDSGALTDSGLAFAGTYYGSATWGDYDGDGRSDLLVLGTTVDGDNYLPLTKVYRNEGDAFAEVFSGLPDMSSGAAAWGDSNNDGRLDLLLVGVNATAGVDTYVGVYHNVSSPQNAPPEAPVDLSTAVLSDGVRLRWSPASDTETPSAALGYNLRVGTTVDGSDVVSPMADVSTGYRRVAAMGNAGESTSLILRGLPPGPYYWAVQTIDASFAGSAFSETGGFVVGGGGAATLVVAIRGTGVGAVTSAPAGIDCGAACAANFPLGSEVFLAATPQPGSVFSGWSGACGGTSPCSIMMDGDKQVTATFDEVPAYHSVSVAIAGFGTVLSSPEGITCGADCEEAFASGTLVILTASAQPGWTFQAWEGACTGSAPCVLTIDGPKTITATFVPLPFTKAVSLSGVDNGGAQWGDYDGDGDLDLAVVGMAATGGPSSTKLYRNAGGLLGDSGASLLNVDGIARWGDYDNDADLDLLLGGWSAAPTKGHFVRLYRNDAGAFATVDVGLPSSVTSADAAWGDYDNDGDLDLAMVGWVSGGPNDTRIYRNEGGSFVDIGAGLTRPGKSVAWGDFDRDGDLDLLAGGDYVATHVYRNDGGRFVEAATGLIGVDSGGATWVDEDGDGDLDVVVSGLPWGGELTTRLYRNDDGAFVETPTPFVGALQPPAWGDFDADGDLDALICEHGATRLYRNDGGSFVDVPSGLPNVVNGRCAWGDFDNDGRLDAFVSGYATARIADVYRGVSGATNTVPEVPLTPVATIGSDGVRLQWTPAIDAQTTSSALTYNVRVGTTDAGSEVVPAMADAVTGYRRLVAWGNAGTSAELALRDLAPGPYYWAVQTIDSSFAASLFTETATFIVPPPPVLSVTTQGTGSGRVTSEPAGIDCGASCAAPFRLDATVALTAMADAGSAFSGWTGACTGTGVCSVAMDGDKSVIANFTDTVHTDLAIFVTDGRVAAPAGQAITYTITASNSGPNDAHGAMLVDSFPPELDSVTWTCTALGGATCTSNGAGDLQEAVDLPVGGSVTFVASGILSLGASGALANSATVSAPDGLIDSHPGDNAASDTDTIEPLLITIGDVSVVEGDRGITPACFTVALSHPALRPVTVDYATADGTAVALEDYLSQSGTLAIPAGMLRQALVVGVIGDHKREPSQSFNVNLSNGLATIADPLGIAMILDDEPGKPGEGLAPGGLR